MYLMYHMQWGLSEWMNFQLCMKICLYREWKLCVIHKKLILHQLLHALLWNMSIYFFRILDEVN